MQLVAGLRHTHVVIPDYLVQGRDGDMVLVKCNRLVAGAPYDGQEFEVTCLLCQSKLRHAAIQS